MPNYFHFDTNGQKLGPVNDQQLKALASRGIITAETVLETEAGHKGKARQIPGLSFPETHMPQRNFVSESPADHAKRLTKPAAAWLLDFSLQNRKLPVINLWCCRIVYMIYWVVILLWAVFATFGLLMFATQGGNIMPLLFIPFVWIGALLAIILARLICEWQLILFDWIIETTEAARIYVDRENGSRT